MKASRQPVRDHAHLGRPVFGLAGTDQFGIVAPGALEGSNVDLAAEFTNLVLAQRGFQANTRVITTSDEMLVRPRQRQALTFPPDRRPATAA